MIPAALREFESRYRQVVEATPMGVHIYRLDGEGRLVLEGANPAADAALGLDHRERVGRALEEAFPGLAGTGVPDQLRRVCEVGEPWQAEELAYRDGRTQGYFELHAFRTAPGEMVVMFRDVSGRRQAEDAVRRSEERFRQLVESTQDWVWEVDRRGRYTYCSPQCERLLGYRPAELLGHTPFERMPVREARRVRVLFGRLASERKSVVAVPNVNVRRDGRVVVLETSGVPFFDSDGELVGYRGIDRDVTERHWAQESIRRLNAELEERVRMRTAQLQLAYEDLESFNYSVSHDLRAPLRAIDGFSLAVLEDSGERLDDAARGYLERVRAATRRMGVLIDDLLGARAERRGDAGGPARAAGPGQPRGPAVGAPGADEPAGQRLEVHGAARRAEGGVLPPCRWGVPHPRQRGGVRHGLRPQAVRPVPAPALRGGIPRYRHRARDRPARRPPPRRPHLGRGLARRGRDLLLHARAGGR